MTDAEHVQGEAVGQLFPHPADFLVQPGMVSRPGHQSAQANAVRIRSQDGRDVLSGLHGSVNQLSPGLCECPQGVPQRKLLVRITLAVIARGEIQCEFHLGTEGVREVVHALWCDRRYLISAPGRGAAVKL